MKKQIRSAVFETNSSSSHSLTLDPEGMRDFTLAAHAIKAGKMVIGIDRHYGWEWERLYRPESKIAYLISQVAASELYELVERSNIAPSVDQMAWLCDRSEHVASIVHAVEKALKIDIILDVDAATDFGVDHESAGIAWDLLGDKQAMLDFVFSQKACVELGNDNDNPPAMMSTDLGRKEPTWPEHYAEKPVEGIRVSLTLSSKEALAKIGEDEELTAASRWGTDAKVAKEVSDLVAEKIFIQVRKTGYHYDLDPDNARQVADKLHGFMASITDGGIKVLSNAEISVEVLPKDEADPYDAKMTVTFEGHITPESVETVRDGFRKVWAENEPGVEP